MLKLKLRKGFTLVELLVVIAIIGVIAALVIVNLSSARAKGRDARRKGDLNSLRTAIETYVDEVPADSGKWPGNAGALYKSNLVNWTDVTDGTLANELITDTSLLPKLPTDPTNTATFHYVYKTDGTNYALVVDLEKPATSDEQSVLGGTYYMVGNPGVFVAGDTY